MSEELRKTIMDAMRSVSERADEFKACCATFDGEWPDAEDKAIYDAEVALVERLRVALAAISDAAQAPVDKQEALRLIKQLRGHSPIYDGAELVADIGPTHLEQEAASFIESMIAAAPAIPQAAGDAAAPSED